MAKLKSRWVKTDIPKMVKIKLWGVMKDYPTYDSWYKCIAKAELFTQEETERLPLSRDTYKSLKGEVMAMPSTEVASLPEELRNWITEIRPEIKSALTATSSDKKLFSRELIKRRKQHFNKLAQISAAIIKDLGEIVPITDNEYEYLGFRDMRYKIKTGSLTMTCDELVRELRRKIESTFSKTKDKSVLRQLLSHLAFDNPDFLKPYKSELFKYAESNPYELYSKLSTLADWKNYFGECSDCQGLKR